MSLRQIIMQVIQIAIFFAFPTIWGWIIKYIPWLTSWFDPQTILGIVTGIIVVIVSWLLGVIGIKKLATTLKTKGLKV